MTLTDKTLFKLLALGLGQDIDFDIPLETIDWPKVIRRAMTEGLDALAFDGVKALYERRPDLTEELDRSLGEDKIQWFSFSMQVEQDSQEYSDKLQKLASFYHREGFKMLVLKGYGLSLDYPTPSHRPTGDIDVYLFGRGMEADARIKETFDIDVSPEGTKHSRFVFHDLPVENHSSFLDVKGHRSQRPVEQYLEREALKSCEFMMGDAKIYVPTAMMNAVFLPCHTAAHFFYEGIPMKQLVDWAVFLDRHSSEVDWAVVRLLLEKAGCFELVRTLNGIVVSRLGVSESIVPDWGRDTALEEKVWQDILLPRRELVGRNVWKKAKDLLASRWRYRLTYRESFGLYFLKRAWVNIRRGIPGSSNSLRG